MQFIFQFSTFSRFPTTSSKHWRAKKMQYFRHYFSVPKTRMYAGFFSSSSHAYDLTFPRFFVRSLVRCARKKISTESRIVKKNIWKCILIFRLGNRSLFLFSCVLFLFPFLEQQTIRDAGPLQQNFSTTYAVSLLQNTPFLSTSSKHCRANYVNASIPKDYWIGYPRPDVVYALQSIVWCVVILNV